MNGTSNPKLTKYSQRLRKEMTAEEKKLWYQFLKKVPYTFHRQKVISSYIVDFYCAKAMLVIELDGTQHYEEKVQTKDTERDACLRSLGLTVLRYSNRQINQEFSRVSEDILRYLTTSSTACGGPPSPRGEG
ncbi:MAG: DUF559 domain-containing protein [Clostridia bacterium]|nr:DUF559 domain-containing protein [Clostridia bacterium]